jgi:hypothetical protein
MFGRKQKRPVEQSVGREVEEQAGRLLCTYAGLPYHRDTARYLAGVILANGWEELSKPTRRRLRLFSIEHLHVLALDILS